MSGSSQIAAEANAEADSSHTYVAASVDLRHPDETLPPSCVSAYRTQQSKANHCRGKLREKITEFV